MFDHLQDLSLAYFNQTPVGWIMSRVTSDSERVADLVTWGLLDTTWSIMNIVTASYFMIIINWRLALIVLSIAHLMIIAVQFRKRSLNTEQSENLIQKLQVRTKHHGVRNISTGARREYSRILKVYQSKHNVGYSCLLSALFKQLYKLFLDCPSMVIMLRP
jgi:ABC-type multidrug transport system fused ATPase/permease subunit